jgi:hypothetical protein
MLQAVFSIFSDSFQPHYALVFTQPPTKMSTRSREIVFLGSKARPVHKDDNLTAVCEPTV